MGGARHGHQGLSCVVDSVTATEQPRPVKDKFDVVETQWAKTLRVETVGWLEGSYDFKIAARCKSCWTPLTVRTADPKGRLVLGSDDCPRREPRSRPGLHPVDVHSDPGSILGASGIVSLGHDEYWSVPTRRAVEHSLDTGSNLAFLGANADYWRVRLEDSGLGCHRRVACFKSAVEDPKKGAADTTDLWRRRPEADPENTLTGMLSEAYPAQGPMVVHDDSHLLLKGTGAKAGDRFPGLVGIEIDRAYPRPGTPQSLQVVMHSPMAAPGRRGTTHYDLTYYTVSSGARNVSTGSMAFSRSFDGPLAAHGITADSVAFARALTTTFLTDMAKSPLGERHPAKPNLAELHASRNTNTGAGFAVDWYHLTAARG